MIPRFVTHILSKRHSIRRLSQGLLALTLSSSALAMTSQVSLAACSIGSLNAGPSGTDVNIQASASCGGGVRAIRILVDGGVVYEIGAPSLSYTWHAGGQSGSHSITAQAAAQGDNNWSSPGSSSITVSLGSGQQQQQQQQQPPYASQFEGALVKGSPDPVWLLQGNQRHWVPNPDTMHSLQITGHAYYSFSDSDINRIPRGSDVTAVQPPPPTNSGGSNSVATSSGTSNSNNSGGSNSNTSSSNSSSSNNPSAPQPPAQVVQQAPYDPSNEGALMTSDNGATSWLFQGGQRHRVPDNTTQNSLYGQNGGRYYAVGADLIYRVPQGSDVGSTVVQQAPPSQPASQSPPVTGQGFPGEIYATFDMLDNVGEGWVRQDAMRWVKSFRFLANGDAQGHIAGTGFFGETAPGSAWSDGNYYSDITFSEHERGRGKFLAAAVAHEVAHAVQANTDTASYLVCTRRESQAYLLQGYALLDLFGNLASVQSDPGHDSGDLQYATAAQNGDLDAMVRYTLTIHEC